MAIAFYNAKDSIEILSQTIFHKNQMLTLSNNLKQYLQYFDKTTKLFEEGIRKIQSENISQAVKVGLMCFYFYFLCFL